MFVGKENMMPCDLFMGSKGGTTFVMFVGREDMTSCVMFMGSKGGTPFVIFQLMVDKSVSLVNF